MTKLMPTTDGLFTESSLVGAPDLAVAIGRYRHVETAPDVKYWPSLFTLAGGTGVSRLSRGTISARQTARTGSGCTLS